MVTSILLAAALLLVPLAMTVQAQGPTGAWAPTDRLTHVQPTADSDFGTDVAMHDDILVVGVPYVGTVEVFEKTAGQWIPTQSLTSSPGFGAAVGASEDTILVGNPQTSQAAIFERSSETWEKTSTLTVPDTECLGQVVDLDEGRLVLGDPCGTDAAYVFAATASTWEQEAELGVSEENRFARSVAIDGDLAVVAGGGDAYVFEAEDGWSSPTKLTEEVAAGRSVAVDSSTVAAAGPSGAVVYQKVGGVWTRTAELTPSDASPFWDWASFGRSLALSGDTLVVGDTGDDPSPGALSVSPAAFDECVSQFGFGVCVPPRPGAVYVFDGSQGSWSQAAKLTSNLFGDDAFGSSLAISEDADELAVGAPANIRSAVGGAIDVDAHDSVHLFTQVTAR